MGNMDDQNSPNENIDKRIIPLNVRLFKNNDISFLIYININNINPIENNQFQEKIELIRITYDYKNVNKDQFLKEERLNAINHLIKIFPDQELYSKLVIPNMGLLIKMIEDNIFSINDKIIRNEKENEEYWENIKDIYDIFHQIIINEKCEPKILKQYITRDFIYKLVISYYN